MTANQLKYWELQEAIRSHQAQEAEARRTNLAKEAETKRSNLEQERLQDEANYLKDVQNTIAQEGLDWKMNIEGEEFGLKFWDTVGKVVKNLFPSIFGIGG